MPAWGLTGSDIPDGDTPCADISFAWQRVLEDDTLVYFTDWPVAGGGPIVWAALGELLGEQATSHEFVVAIESWHRSELDG